MKKLFCDFCNQEAKYHGLDDDNVITDVCERHLVKLVLIYDIYATKTTKTDKIAGLYEDHLSSGLAGELY